MRRFAGPLIVAMTTVLFMGATPATQAQTTTATPRPAAGVNFHATWSDYNNTQRLAVLDKLAAAGVEWVRVDIGWSSFEYNCKGCLEQWYINRVDFIVDEARARGIKVLAMLHRTPSWANGGGAVNVPPNNPQDYADFARWAAEHYRGRIDAWEVWNEPNLKHFWNGSVAQYTALLKAAYPAIKAGDPGAKVVFGGVAYHDLAYLEAAYQQGAQGSFDVMATHPYMGFADLPPESPDPSGNPKYAIVGVPAVKSLMDTWGDGGKEIWFTEFGWSAHANWTGVPNWDRGVTEQQQADYLPRTFELLKSYPYVTNAFWYVERNEETGDVHLDNYGLLRRDLSEKPVYGAMRDYLKAGVVPAGPQPQAPDGSDGQVPAGCTIVGTPGDDTLVGTAGDDVICGGGGEDTLIGGPGNDTLIGGPGGDTLVGGPGHDTLVGGPGRNKLKGGPGRDKLKARAGKNIVKGGGGVDRIFTRNGGRRDIAVGGGGKDICKADRKDRIRSCPKLKVR